MAFLQVSRKVDYALRAVIHLANEEANDRACSVAEIAARERIPRQFLEKIVQHLIHTGLVRSRRGPRGGYVLGRPAEQMTFRDVIEAVEGPDLAQRLRRRAPGLLPPGRLRHEPDLARGPASGHGSLRKHDDCGGSPPRGSRQFPGPRLLNFPPRGPSNAP